MVAVACGCLRLLAVWGMRRKKTWCGLLRIASEWCRLLRITSDCGGAGAEILTEGNEANDEPLNVDHLNLTVLDRV